MRCKSPSMRGHRACHHLEMGNLRMRSVKGKNVTGKQKWNVFKRWMENQGYLKKEVIVRCCFSESYFLPYKALFSFPTLPLDSLSPPVPSSTEEKSRLHAIFFSHTLPVCFTAFPILFLPWLVGLQALNRDYARSFMPREPTHPTRLLFPALILISDVNILERIFYLLENIYSSTGLHQY